jgi:hypothetical protein
MGTTIARKLSDEHLNADRDQAQAVASPQTEMNIRFQRSIVIIDQQMRPSRKFAARNRV